MDKNHIPYQVETVSGSGYWMQAYLDFVNARLRLDDYRGNLPAILACIQEKVNEHRFSKVIVKARAEDVAWFLSHGYMLEAVFNGYFNGSAAYGMSLYFTDERRTSDFWMQEDQILQQVISLPQAEKRRKRQEGYSQRLAEKKDAEGMAHLYGSVFKTYPTPMQKAEYIRKVMEEGTVFYLIEHKGSIVSAASAEMNPIYHHAEITDCATLPEHRKFGFMKELILSLEEELRRRKIFCAYSLARALSFGMNAAFHQLGYQYTGRMTKNCNIFDKFEDMNLWVKNLAFHVEKG